MSTAHVLNMKCTLLVLALYLAYVASLSCKDEAGSDVDWFVVYKAPRELNPSGTVYYFTTSASDTYNLTLSKSAITDSHSIVGRTLQPLWSNETLLYLLYNDQAPERKTSFAHGHAKGVVLFDSKAGVWLVHSVPHFLNFTQDGYQYPHSGRMNGQAFLCVTFPADAADLIGRQLLYINPYVYQFNIPPSVKDNVPNLVGVAHNKTVTQSPWILRTELRSSGGVTFVSYAKYHKYAHDLYSSWLAPSLNTSLYVQSWPNGANPLPSDCNEPHVMNVEYVQLPFAQPYSSRVDHSKWAVSASSASPWLCVGDLNRMKPQERRSGGTVCMQQKSPWAAFASVVAMLQACPAHL